MEAEEIFVQVGLRVPEEENWAFRYHPGYQEGHPAHPEGVQSYFVTGTVEAGKVRKEKGKKSS